MFRSDREGLSCFPLVSGCQPGISCERGVAMRPGPQAARCCSGYGNRTGRGSTRSGFQGLSAFHPLSAGLRLDLGARSEPSAPAGWRVLSSPCCFLVAGAGTGRPARLPSPPGRQ